MEIFVFENEHGVIDIAMNDIMPTHEETDRIIELFRQYQRDYSPTEIEEHNEMVWEAQMHQGHSGCADKTETLKERRKANAIGYVYAIRSGELVKIGHTKKPDKRISLYKTENPYPVEVLHIVKVANCRHVEAQIQERFSGKKVKGEWFELEEGDLEVIGDILQANAA